MVRQISVSNPPGPSAAADGVDLGGWLTQELRVKGTPLPSRPPSVPPESGPADLERAVLAGWLTRDLIPKHSVRALAAHTARSSESPSDLPAATLSLSPS